jgi:hypothetical protein
VQELDISLSMVFGKLSWISNKLKENQNIKNKILSKELSLQFWVQLININIELKAITLQAAKYEVRRFVNYIWQAGKNIGNAATFKFSTDTNKTQ